MPIYEYECSSCGYRADEFQKIDDKLLTTCPECETENLVKLVSAAAFKLKGSGWYETDFKDKKPKKELSTKSDAKTNNEKKDKPKKESSTKSDAKKAMNSKKT